MNAKKQIQVYKPLLKCKDQKMSQWYIISKRFGHLMWQKFCTIFAIKGNNLRYSIIVERTDYVHLLWQIPTFATIRTVTSKFDELLGRIALFVHKLIGVTYKTVRCEHRFLLSHFHTKCAYTVYLCENVRFEYIYLFGVKFAGVFWGN